MTDIALEIARYRERGAELAKALRAERATLLARLRDIEITLASIGSGDRPEPGVTTAEVVVDVVARFYGRRRGDLLGPSRLASVSGARHMAMYLSRTCVRPRPSYPDLGRVFGRDHTTVLVAVHTMQGRLAHDAKLLTDAQAIEKILEARAHP